MGDAAPEPESLPSSLSSEEAALLEPMEVDLLPTLLQIFLTVGLGWAAGTLGVLGKKEARGLGVFVGKFSLPALIFISLASLDLSNIKWSFVLAILIAKSGIFGLVFLLDFVLNKNMSRAALFAIYSTQTNDFGMGLPILTSVFGPGHALVGLLYLVAPISLLILNPIGFVMLELGRDKKETVGPLATTLTVLRGLITNPVVAMTVLGVLGNLAFSSAPPPHLVKFLSALGAAFSALAPFSLGLSMAGKLGGIRGASIKPVLALVTVKSLVTPLVTYLLVGRVTSWLDGAPSPLLSNFGLLLGSFPAALGVASYATEYNVEPDLVSTAIVIGTIASAPMLYAIANILSNLSESAEILSMSDHSYIDSVFSIGSVVLVIGLLLSRDGWRRAPNLLTLSLLLLTLLSSAAGLLLAYLPCPSLALLHLTALHASRLATPALALRLLLLARGSPALSSPTATALLLLAGPLLSLSTLLLLLTPYTPSLFLAFGPQQDHLSLGVHLTALVPTLACLVLLTNRPPASLPGVHIFRHTLLLLTLATAMFVSIGLAVGRALLYPGPYPGAFRALVCINSVLSSGQGILFLGVFGLDQAQRLVKPIKTVWERVAVLLTNQDMADAFVMPDSNNNKDGPEKQSMDPMPPAELQMEKERKISLPSGRSV